MKNKKVSETTLCFFVSICAIIISCFGASNQYSPFCKFTISSTNGEVSMSYCSEKQNKNRLHLWQTTLIVDNMEARWSANTNLQDFLLLSTSFSARGSGQIMFRLIKISTEENELFCGILTKSRTNRNFNVAVNVWLQCRQDRINLKDKMMLSLQKWRIGRIRRDIPNIETFNVELPGCTLPEFRRTTLCQKEEEQKIRFHVRRIANRRSIRVALARSIYTSRFEDEERARGRRYHVAVLEESPIDIWFGEAGRLIEMKSLKYPNRNVRFRDLETKKTFVVAVWRADEVKQYYKKITVC